MAVNLTIQPRRFQAGDRLTPRHLGLGVTIATVAPYGASGMYTRITWVDAQGREDNAVMYNGDQYPVTRDAA